MTKTIQIITQLLLGFALILLLLFLMQGMAKAESNPIQALLDSAVQNGAVGGGAWRSTSGNVNIFSYDYVYDIHSDTNSLGAGLLVGGDSMKDGHNASVWNDVKGGFSINYKFNLGAIGFTNAQFKAYAGNAIATPRNSGTGVGNITFVGVDYSVTAYKSVMFHIAPAWQTRTGQGSEFDRNYLGIQAFVSVGGGTASVLAANDKYLEQEYAVLGR